MSNLKKKSIVFFTASLLSIFFILSLVSSLDETSLLGTFSQDEPLTLYQSCASCSYVNLSSIITPTEIVSYNVNMIKSGADYSYLVFDTNETGHYIYTICGDVDGGFKCENIGYDITYNGKPNPSGSVNVFFSLLFLIIVGGMLSLLFLTIFRMVTWDFNVKDLVLNISSYFVVFATYILSKFYLGNEFIDGFLVWLIGVGAVTMVILPIIAFAITMMRRELDG